jgi:hypothetical protein
MQHTPIGEKKIKWTGCKEDLVQTAQENLILIWLFNSVLH